MRNLRLFTSLIFAGALMVWGQGFTASILGTVTDNTGAVVPQATVTVTNIGTGQTTVLKTDAGGNYTALQLPPGDYRVVVEVQGFKRSVREPVTLQVDQRQLLNFQLELGQVSENVTVTAEAAQIQAETATVGAAVTHTQTAELPLNGRNFIQLNLLLPGAAPMVKGSNLSSEGGSIEVHGLPENSNSFWLNGVDNTTNTVGQYVVNIPAYSIEEFRVMSPTYDTEFGRTAGAQINLVTRSGANAFHGDTYLFIRNSVFDAKNYFDPAGTIPAFRRGQYGGDLGGRIIKDKLFFYGAYEGLTYAQGESDANIVPTHQETLGNFSDITTIIKDPTTGLQFPGNIIPASRLNATGLAYAAFFPPPNSGTNTLLVSPTASQSDDVSLAKVDWVITSKDRLSVHWALDDANFQQPIAMFGNITNIPGFGLDQKGAHDITTGLSETHIFSPTFISEFRMGWNRYEFQYYPQANTKDWCVVLAIQGCDDVGPIDWDVPEVSFNSVYSNLGGSTGQVQYGPFDTTFLDPTVTWIKGKHTLKFGWDYHYYFTNSTNGQSPRGTFTFRGTWTGNPLSDLLLGLPYQASKIVISDEPQDVIIYAIMKQTAAFVQDDFRVSSRLTLNLGLRYELALPAQEAHNHIANLNFSNGVANAALEIPGQNGVGSTLYNSDYKQFAPRFGFAYTPRDKWVVRGGYGIFYQLVILGSPGVRVLHNDPPFQSTYTIIGDGKNITINNALVAGLVANVPAFAAFNNYMKGGMIHQFSLGVQHELPWGLFLDVGYVGTRGRDINNAVSVNTPFPGPGTVQTRRPDINYADISIVCPCTTSQYDGLETRLEKRLSKGMQFVLSYTWSRSFDNTGTAQNPHDLASQWGPSGFDVPSHLSFSYVYHLPVGKGLTFLSNMNRLGDAILGGWQFNGIYQYHSGQPFTPILPIDNSNTLVNSDRPNLVGNPYQSTATCRTGTPTCWANPAAFATPPQYTYGNAGANEVRGPNFSQLDFALAKNFNITEKTHVEFRAEAFNVFNRVNFYNPTATLTSSFGVITSAQASRQLQFGVRYVF